MGNFGKGGMGKGQGAGPSGDRVPAADRIESVLNDLQVGYFELDLKGNLTFANAAMARALGHSPEDLESSDSWRLDLLGTSEEFPALFERILLTGQNLRSETVCAYGRDGRKRFIELSVSLVVDGQGKAAGYRGFARDVTDRERALELTRATLDCQSAHICILDRDGVVRVVNKAWAAFSRGQGTARTLEVGNNYLGRLESARYSGDLHAAHEAEGVRAVLEGRRREFTQEFPVDGGGRMVRWFMLTVTPMTVGGAVSGAVLSRMDITERKMVEEELTTLYKAMDTSIDGLALLGSDGSPLYMNPAFAHIYGYDAPVEMAGKTWRDLHPSDQLGVIDGSVLPALRKQGYWSGELKGLKRDGELFIQSTSLTHMDQGQVTIVSIRDVTDRRRTEAALRLSEERFRTIFESVTEGILVLDPEGPAAVAANPALLEMFGYPRDADVGKLDMMAHIVEEDGSRVIEDLRRVISENYHEPTEYRAMTRTGSPIWIRCLGTRTTYAGRTVDLVAVSDITLRKQAEEELERRERLLKGVAEASTLLLAAEDLPAALNTALSIIGRSTDADRVYVFEYHDDTGSGDWVCSQRFEWAREGIAPQIDNPDLQRVPLASAIMTTWQSIFETHGAIAGRPSDFPGEIQGALEAHGIRSLLMVPIRTGTKIIGFVGLDDCGTEREWSSSDQSILVTFAAAFGGALERKRFHEALVDSEERMRLLVEGSKDFFYYIHDEKFSYSYISPSFEEITGYSVEYLRGEHPAIMTDNPLNAEAMLRTAKALREGVASEPYLCEIRHKNGERLTLQVYERPLVKDGKVVGIQGIGQNVTERIRMERALRESEERSRFLVENVPGSMFYIQRPDMSYEYISPTAEAITGYAPEYLMGDHEPIATDNPINEEAIKSTQRVLREGVTLPPYLFEIRHKEGRKIMLEAYEKPIFKEGKVAGLLGLLHDISQRLALEDQVANYQKLEMMGHLSAGLAHEIRNPLFAINVTLQALQKKLGEEEVVRPYLDIVAEQSKRLSALMRDMLDLGQPVDPAQRTSEDLVALVREALALLREERPASEEVIDLRLPDAACSVIAQRHRIVQALFNILENAVHFSPESGSVVVTVESDGDDVIVRIADRGPGVAPHLVDKIFQPFMTSRPGGTGLGLAIAERIMGELGGRIWVENNEPKPGCTFFLSLPKEPEAQRKAARAVL